LNKLSALTLLLLFVLLASMLVNVPSAKARETASTDKFIQFYLFTLYSPLNGTYNSRFLDLNLSFTVGLGIRYTLYYYLDGKYGDEIPFTVENSTEMHVTYPANAFTKLPELSEGSHSLTIFIICSGLMRSLPSNNGTVYFTIDTNSSEQFVPQPVVDLTPPEFLYLHVENQTSNQTKTRLFFQISEPRGIRQVMYSIDGLENKALPNETMIGDFEITHYYVTNLTGLASGYHNITIYATDSAGNNGASKTVTFHVDVPEAEPFSLTINSAFIAALFTGAVVALGFLLKRKRNQRIVNDISLGKLG
jgi:hypothetical protein